MSCKPLMIDLFCGLGGWSHGFMAEGWDCIGFDIVEQRVGEKRYPGRLILQDVLTLSGRQFKDADAIAASPPCQAYSYMAMPWTRSKREISWQRWERDSPFGDFHLNDLFNACMRIKREASEAAGRRIPLIIENVCGAQPWVGSAQYHYGSYYLWGDVPALMPSAGKRKNSGGSWFSERDGQAVERNDPRDAGRKNGGGSWFNVAHNTVSGTGQNPVNGIKQGGEWWHDPDSITRRTSSRSSARKAASALIAEIPFGLSNWIAQCFKPDRSAAA